MAESFGISAGDLGEHLSGGSKHSPKHFHTKARGLRADKYRIAPEGTLPPITSDSYPTRFADFLKDPTDSEAVAIVHYFDNAVSDTRPLFKAAIFDVVLPDRKGPVSVIDELLLATDTAPDLSAISAVMQGLKASAKKCIWGGKKSVCVLVDRRLKDAVLDAVRQGDAQRSAVLLDMTKQNEQGALDHAVLALQEGRRYGVPSLEDLGDASHVRSRSPDLQFPTAIRQRDCRLLKTVLDKMRPEQKRSEAFRVDLAKEMMIQVGVKDLVLLDDRTNDIHVHSDSDPSTIMPHHTIILDLSAHLPSTEFLGLLRDSGLPGCEAEQFLAAASQTIRNRNCASFDILLPVLSPAEKAELFDLAVTAQNAHAARYLLSDKTNDEWTIPSSQLLARISPPLISSNMAHVALDSAIPRKVLHDMLHQLYEGIDSQTPKHVSRVILNYPKRLRIRLDTPNGPDTLMPVLQTLCTDPNPWDVDTLRRYCKVKIAHRNYSDANAILHDILHTEVRVDEGSEPRPFLEIVSGHCDSDSVPFHQQQCLQHLSDELCELSPVLGASIINIIPELRIRSAIDAQLDGDSAKADLILDSLQEASTPFETQVKYIALANRQCPKLLPKFETKFPHAFRLCNWLHHAQNASRRSENI